MLDEAKAMANAAHVSRVSKINPIDEESVLKIAQSAQRIELDTKNAFEFLSRTKLEPLLKANNKTGANMALGYMAALQSMQTYEDAINLGVSRVEAAAIGWGTTLGVYAIGKSGLGELFFPQLKDVNKVAYREAISKMQMNIKEGLEHIAPTLPKKTKLLKLMDLGKNSASKFWQGVKDHSLGFVGKSIGEGIEEVTEEAVSDFFKATHNLAAELGAASTDKKFSFADAADRYLMSFVGGTIGGSVFGAADLVTHLKSPESNKQELVYLLRNGRKGELLAELEVLKNKGKLGNTALSTKFTTDPSDPNQRLFESAETQEQSQNNFIYNSIKNYIESVDNAINQEEINYSDQDILDKLANADIRMAAVQEVIGKDGINGRYLQRFNSLTNEVIEQKAKIQQLSQTTPDSYCGL